ncbi:MULTISPECIES: nitrate regulatory protein [unclassified Variovorax]|uniref:nitrate regulatory protein n=1 Tax=unclassified Variovorax TaxID=663243 RepID=UPI00076CC1F0|nr:MULTISPECIES: nitrate regulatory protein [unclassified Variovorax]KWT87292.1 Response regulator NasT [Variovorax sp. WDL1]PNG51982.1 Nitrate regulatory protein [Variovorax sp. B4]PNG54522.1 Nitrate regulatory protein [Variovorax sp. B2]VTV15487.1 Nitrate regulatory protein [Variovorax sp. WDL1]
MKSGLSFLIAALRCEIDELDQLGRTSALVVTIGRLVHALQRERGISNVLLASGGRRFVAQREAQIAACLRAEQAVRSAFEQLDTEAVRIGNGARLFSRIAWVLPGLDALPELRRRIAAMELSAPDATAAFVKLVAGLLAVVFEAADGATDPEISRLLVAMFHFMQGKEFAGQERACGAAAFAAGRNDGARQQQWLHLIESQERCFQVFVDFSSATLGELWRASQSAPQLAEQERLRRVGCASPAGVSLDAELSQAWFDCCSLRIDAMQAIEERLAADLRLLCEQKTTRARAELQAHEALFAQLKVEPGAAAAAFLDDLPTGDVRNSQPRTLAATAPIGRQLERSVLEMVQDQSHRLQAMGDELETVRAALNERKLVERAKGLLMAHRRLTEEEAHKMLRRTAMSQGRRLIEVAESVLSMAEYLPGEPAR